MHILTILCKGGWMPTNLSEGWRRLGCSVEEFFYGTHMGKSWTNTGLKENRNINKQLIDFAKRLKSEGRLDLIFAVIYDDVLMEDTARQLRSLDVPMVNYHVDLVGQWYRVLRTGKYFDLLACAQKDNWAGLRWAGIRPYYMPMAANPVASDEISKRSSFDGVLYLGSPWLYRYQVLVRLASKGIPLRIYGHNWTPGKSGRKENPLKVQPFRKNMHDVLYYLVPRIREEGLSWIVETIRTRMNKTTSGERLFGLSESCINGAYGEKDFVPLVQGASINLGFTHFSGIPGTSSERRQMRLREFEIPMAGGFYLTQDCVQIRELFEPGKHLETWGNEEELLEKIIFYLDRPEACLGISREGKAHCMKYHTWQNRFAELLKELHITLPQAGMS